MTPARTRDLGPILRHRYGKKVRKLCLRLGATCPNRDGTRGRGGCAFCAERQWPAPPPIAEQLRRGQEKLGADTAVVAYLQDHTATHLPPERLDEILIEVRQSPRVVAITVGTRPDALPPAILEVLCRHAAAVDLLVEVGLQTASDPTLRFIGRMHDVPCFEGAVARLHRAGLRVGAHVILGLPTPGAGKLLLTEGPAAATDTARLLGRLGVEAVKIHNCHVLRGTRLEALFAQGLFAPPELDGYLERLIPFLEHLPAQTEIHRLTGEARYPALVAPAFTAEKQRTLQRIRAELEVRDVWQGSRASNAAGGPSPSSL